MGGKVGAPDKPSGFPVGERLESWKEIADYLKRGVRTVRRWEKEEGLPVHRHLHHKQGTIYAHKQELDAWRASRRAHPAPIPVSVTRPKGRIVLALLPLENLSGDPEQEYFSDGLTEEMITQLTRLNSRRLGIIAPSSAMCYKGTKKGTDQIGQELGVGYILKGSVRRAGEQVRISAQLIQVSDQTHLWAESYERTLADVFAIQSEIARRIARSLMIELLPHQEATLALAPTTNPAAHEAYLKGRYYWNKQTEVAIKKSCDNFEQAIAEDPNYALAYVGISDCYRLLGFWDALPPTEVMPKAKAAAVKALQIDDELGEGHASLAGVTGLYDRDFSEAGRLYKRAIELSPGYAIARQSYAMVYLAPMGRLGEAIAEMKRAQRLDPLSLFHSTILGWAFHLARQYDQAIKQYRKTLDLDPNYHLAYSGLGWAYEQKSMFEEAIAAFQKARAFSGGSTLTIASLGHCYGSWGRTNEAQSLLAELNELSKARYVSPLDIAILHTGLNQRDQAFEWLEKANKERCSRLIWLKPEPRFDKLRSDPRFQSLLRRMNFPVR